MTKQVPCAWCRQPIESSGATGGRGRPRRYCKQSCRQRDFEARRRARELGLAESDLVVARAQVDRLDDLIYVLSCAVADVDKDMALDGSAAQVRRSLEWLLGAARPLAGAGESWKVRASGAGPGAPT